MRELMNNLGESKPDNLVAGSRFPLTVKGVELAAGQGVLKRGTVLAVNAATGDAHAVDSALTDGMNEPDCILAETMDTSGGAVKAVAYATGYFFRSGCFFGGTDTYEKHEKEMRRLGLHLTSSVDEKGADA